MTVVFSYKKCVMRKGKFKYLIFLVLVIDISGCSKIGWRHYWPYSNVNPSQVQKQLPRDYDECLRYLDMILKDESKNYFKNQDSTLAVIEICDQIGGFFITNWCLDYFTSTGSGIDYLMTLPEHAPGVARLFTKAGIMDPEAMMRVIFSCYYRKLNGVEYNWEEEIKKTRAYWPNAGDAKLLCQVRQSVKKQEWVRNDRFFFNRLSENDSVIIFLNRPPSIFSKKPNAFFLSGVVNFKRPEEKNINVRITNILSNKGTRQLLSDDRMVQIGDTLTGSATDWHKKDARYFNYSQNTFYPNKIPRLNTSK